MGNSKKRILILIDWFDPAYKAGGPIRSCVNFVSHMHKDFELFVLTGCYDLGSTVILPGIEPGKWNDYSGKAQVMYAWPQQLNNKNIIEIINELTPDFIYLNGLFSKQLTLLPLWLKKTGKIKAPIILAPRGMLKQSALAFKPFKKKIFLSLAQAAGIDRLVKFQATDSDERKDILKYFSKAQVLCANNLPGSVADEAVWIDKKKGNLSAIFVGRVHPIKNLAYLLAIIQRMKGEVDFTIIGAKEDEAYWKECNELIEKMPSNITIKYLGEQAHDRILSEINKHHIFILPTKGENFGHAIFESLSVGRPVIISDQTPWRNLSQQKAGWDLPLEEPPAFEEALLQAINWDQDEYNEWSKSALTLAKKFVEQSDIKESYLKLFG